MNNKHGVYMTRQQFNKITRNQHPKKHRQLFTTGSDVLVNVDISKKGRWVEASVLSYDTELDVYTVLTSDGLTLKFKSNKIKGWWSK